MGHQHHDGQNCERVYLMLCELFDPDIASARAREIRSQIAACPECVAHLRSEETVRGLVKDCCGGAHAPRPLRERIITSITQISYTEVRYTGKQGK